MLPAVQSPDSSSENVFMKDVVLLGRAEKQDIINGMYKYLTLPFTCEKLGYDMQRVMVTLDFDDEFAQAMSIVDKHLTAYGEEELKRRAINGVDSVVSNNGKIVYVMDKDGNRRALTETKYSDSLLKFYLETQRRDKFGAKIEVNHTHKGHISLPTMSPELMQVMLAMQRGDNVQLIQDESYEGEGYEVIDAEFTPVAEEGADEFDLL